MKKGIVGNGGFGREIFHAMSKEEQKNTVFFVDDEYYSENSFNTLPLSKFDKDKYELIIAIADCKVRKKIVDKLPKDTKFFTFIDPSAQIHDNDIEIGEGGIICAGTIITTNVKIGKHCHLNLITTIGHDCTIGDYFTTAPGVQISGNEVIGDFVYFGTRSCIKQELTICDNVTVGMNAGVVKNITEPGVYVGTPAKKIK